MKHCLAVLHGRKKQNSYRKLTLGLVSISQILLTETQTMSNTKIIEYKIW